MARFFNPGALHHFRNFPKWDARLNLAVCDRYNNGELTIILKLFLDRIDPPGGFHHGIHVDTRKNPHNIIPWGPYFNTWKQRFKNDVESAWDGKFWLKSPDRFDKWDYEDKNYVCRPNIWCRFEVQLLSSRAGAHKTIKCVRLHNAETSFRSNSGLFDHRDTNPQPRKHGSTFRTHVHEVGHLLGLEHVGVEGPPSLTRNLCRINVEAGIPNASNADICYGVWGSP